MDPYGPAGYTVIGPDGGRYGPVDAQTLRAWVGEGRIVSGTSIEDPISGRVQPAAQMPELADLFQAPPYGGSPRAAGGTAVGAPPNPYSSGYGGSGYGGPTGLAPGQAPYAYAFAGPPKQKVIAILLAFFLGAFGIHRFYLGHNGTGIAMLLITVLTCGYGGCISGIWAIIDIILIATDGLREANGRALA